MERIKGNPGLLELIACPAFSARDGIVTAVNSGAQSLLITPGTAVTALIETGKEDYSAMKEGCMSLLIVAGAKRFGAFVNRDAEGDLFLLDQEEDDPTQMGYALASCFFRQPLQRIMDGAESILRMPEELDPKVQKNVNDICRGAFQILRLVNNMTDAIPYAQEEFFCQAVDIDTTLREIVEKAASLLEANRIAVRFTSSVSNTFAMVNRDKLERALHNLILNAGTSLAGVENPEIQVALSSSDRQFMITVTDNGCGIPDDIFSSLFYRYQRKPTLENARFGIGLGLPLVRAVAAAHGGTVLVERRKPAGTKVTMTIAIRKYPEHQLRTPRLHFDSAGDFDHALVDLADILPSDFYGKR